MITVRFPTGFSVQYNDGNYVVRHAAGYTDIYTKKDGQWIAQAPNDALIEVERPCRAYDAVRQPSDVLDAVIAMATAATSGDLSNSYRWRDLKAALKRFNAIKRSWK